jgi:hypothetical protein
VGDPNTIPRAGSQTTQGGPAGTNDTFIKTNTANGTDTITVTFTTPVTLVSFDWEILPDGSCAQPCANRPDFKFVVNSNAVPTFHYFGVDPGSAQNSQPSNGALGGGLTYSHFIASGAGIELAPQLIGTYVAPGSGIAGVTRLDFIDWPVAIAIDNLKVNTPPPPTRVPQPSAMMMLALGGALLGWKLRRA